VNYGYEGTALLPVTIGVPGNLPATSPIQLHADAHWLVCNEDECIPGSAPLSLELPVAPGAPQPSAEKPLFDTARKKTPLPLPRAQSVIATHDADTWTFEAHGVPPDAKVTFFPFDKELIEHAAAQEKIRTDDGFVLKIPRAAQKHEPPTTIDGVLVVDDTPFAVSIGREAPAPALEPFLFAFLGGLLLNLMPCVFPILALKAFGLLDLAGEHRSEARAHGVAYTAGVLASFLALGGALLAVRAGGATIGWGFQLQSPAVIAGLAALFFWMSLMLLDVTSVGGSFMGVGNKLAASGGARGAFFTGVLATIVATPCSAPFMGTALGYALTQPAAVALGVFVALGLGLAFPYLAIAFVPRLGALLPRPGRWMDTLKQLLAFPLLGTVVWLTWVASVQSGPSAVVAILGMLVLLAFAAWAGRHFGGRTATALAAAAAVAALVVGTSQGTTTATARASEGWEPYSTQKLEALLKQGKPVFVDFTAAWCVTCQVNERLVLGRPRCRTRCARSASCRSGRTGRRPIPTSRARCRSLGGTGCRSTCSTADGRTSHPASSPQLLTTDIVIAELDELDRRNDT
jgi:thiol:disulfide interchange protein DsbD